MSELKQEQKKQEVLEATKWQRRTLQFLRIFLGCTAIWFISKSAALNTDFLILAISFSLGVILAAFLLARESSLVVILGAHLALGFVLDFLLSVSNSAILSSINDPQSDFLVPLLGEHIWLCAGLYFIGLIGTWLFWRFSHALTIESLLGVAGVIWLLSAHRNYRLDAPKELASLSWKVEQLQLWGVEPQHLVMFIGILCLLVFILYVGLAAFRPIYARARIIETKARPAYLQLSLAMLAGIALLSGITYSINDWYAKNIGRASNGVGPSSELGEGDSNLGFNSAVTATRQPAAILRLDADYAQNTNAPMLYLREGALSEFVGREFTKAKDKFDTDIAGTGLGEVFVAANKPLGAEYRVAVPQSVYIISRHQAPFAIDQVQKIRPLKNPNPNRFQHAYQALSLAPTRPLKEIATLGVGDPSWDKETWEHYTRAPGSLSKNEIPRLDPNESPGRDKYGEDLRYRQMAEQLGGGGAIPLLKAARIIRYLSEESIYTRSPGHDVAEDGDPVAPYLFSEKKRGYCVHFAHAAVYMFRLLGIPARIGTGYQTDTRYAKDGHILLMLGDRHAWPEVYITGKGWTVLDIAPAQAENEPELVPDQNLLEDLMSELDPAPEFLESQPSKVSEKQSPLNQRIVVYIFVGIILAALLLLVLRKLFLYHGYRLAKDADTRAKRGYVAAAARLADLGAQRIPGETRVEFTKRLAKSREIDASKLALFLEQSVYPSAPVEHPQEAITEALKSLSSDCSKSYPWYQRAMGKLSTTSVFRSRSL